MTACASASAAVSRFSATSRRIEELYDARLSVAAIARKTERGERPHPMSRNNSNSDRDLRGARPFSGAGHPLVPFDTETLS
jgi:hypothetical protein